MDDEEWRRIPLPGLGRFEASNKGRIRHCKRRKPRLFHKSCGYPQVTLRDSSGVLRTNRVHRLIFAAWGNEPLTSGMEIHHIDGDPNNNAAENLMQMTPRENTCEQAQLRLSPEIVLRIVHMYYDGKESIIQLAKRFGVSKQTIYYVVKRNSWTHITDAVFPPRAEWEERLRLNVEFAEDVGF